jgi:hypothetical protein
MKNILLLTAGLMIANSTNAQFYFRAGAGYAIPQAGQTLDGTAAPYSGTRNTTTFAASYVIKNASFSSGITGVLGLGYMFSDHIGVELSAPVGIVNTKYTFTDNNVSYGGYAATESDESKANTPILLVPSLILQTGGSSSLNAYSRLGAALPLNTQINYDQVIYLPGPAITIDVASKVKSSFSIGFCASAGLQYKASDRMTVWGELSFLSMSLFIKEVSLKSVTENGFSVPLDSVSGPHTIKYSKNVVVDTNYAQFPTYSQPFSNVGVNVGISFRLSDGKRSRNSEMITDDKYFKRRGK